jgi:hypothetical protein
MSPVSFPVDRKWNTDQGTDQGTDNSIRRRIPEQRVVNSFMKRATHAEPAVGQPGNPDAANNHMFSAVAHNKQRIQNNREHGKRQKTQPEHGPRIAAIW